MLTTYFKQFKNCIDLERLLRENLLEIIYSEHIYVAEVLAKQQELLLLAVR